MALCQGYQVVNEESCSLEESLLKSSRTIESGNYHCAIGIEVLDLSIIYDSESCQERQMWE